MFSCENVANSWLMHDFSAKNVRKVTNL